MNLKKLILFIVLFCGITRTGSAQTTTTCFEIESILADACGTNEGENEMVRFLVGPAPLNTANLTVTWPNNPFRGICQNATTAGKVAALNATIQGCGYLLEPPAGILPANSKVLFITSEAINTAANSFTNLNDTLYVIFQCAGNTNGHFVNYNSTPDLRTLTMTFNPPAGCTDQVTYDRSLLINQVGGYGGGSALQNGGRIDYDFAGNPTYTNSGCQAPFDPITANAGPTGTVCNGDTIVLNGIASGEYASVFWTGGTGTFLANNNDTTAYISNPGEIGNVTLTLNVVSNCNDTIRSNVSISVTTVPIVSITPSGSTAICNGTTVTLQGTGATTYTWNTGASAASINAGTAGTYTVTGVNMCGSDTATIPVTVNFPPSMNVTASGSTAICPGTSVTFTATGADTYQWQDGSTNPSFNTSTFGTYTVIGYNSCGSDSDTVSVTNLPIPLAGITGTNTICNGSVTILSATGGDTYLWSNGSTNANTPLGAGNHHVIAYNNCGFDTAYFTVNSFPLTAAFTASPPAGVTPLSVTFTNTSSSAVSYSWNFGNGNTASEIAPTATYTDQGTFTVTLVAQNIQGCTDTAISVIIAEPPASVLEVPNIFTPNGDQMNDQFKVIHKSIESFSCVIYDRWGIKLTELTSPDSGWDGNTNGGKMASDGTYYFVLIAKGFDGKEFEEQGAFQLIR